MTPAQCFRLIISYWKNYTSAELNDPSLTISLHISDLDPFTNYVLVLYPVNFGGQGISSSTYFTTLIACKYIL